MSGFEEKKGIKGVIGVIDGSHIPISQPLEYHENYVNRKQFHSIILQAVCDHENLITDVYAGWPGSVHDAHVFKRSTLSEKRENDCVEMNPTGRYLIGDAAYPLKEYLITPFRDNGHLSIAQKTFNYSLSSTRMLIEHTFGLLKGTWRRLKYCAVNDLNTILPIVMGACILHNLCIFKLEILHDFIEVVEDVNGFENMPLFPNSCTGIDKRKKSWNICHIKEFVVHIIYFI